MSREASALTVSNSFTAARATFAWNAPQSARSVTVPFLHLGFYLRPWSSFWGPA